MKKVPMQNLNRMHSLIKNELLNAFEGHLESSQFIMGPSVKAFEENFSKISSISHCMGVANGTDALELVLESLDIGKGDQVLVPAMTFTATAEAIVRVGAIPIFCDVNEDTLCVDVKKLEDAMNRIKGPVKAAIIVHLYGRYCDMQNILNFCKTQKIHLIEDCAQAQGAQIRINGALHHAGSLGVAGTFSFYPGKNLGALGDGGMVVCQDTGLAQRVRLLRDHGRTDKYTHVIVGRNSRLDSLQASFLNIKLKYLNQWNISRQNIAQKYYKELMHIDEIQPLVEPRNYHEHVFHQFVVKVGTGPLKRDAWISRLRDLGIESGVHYPICLHKQPAFESYSHGLSLPVAEHAALNILSLPLDPLMTEDEFNLVVRSLNKIRENCI